MGVKIVFFDFDGVIVDTTKIKHDLFVSIAEDLAPGIGAHLNHALLGELTGAERSKVSIWLKEKTNNKISPNVFLTLFDLGLKVKDIEVKFSPGFEEFFARLLDDGVAAFIVSAAPESDIKRVLKGLKFDFEQFAGIFGSGFGSKQEMMLKLLEKNNSSASDSMFYGDMPSDLLAAERAEIPFIRVESFIGNTISWPHSNFTTIKDFISHYPK